MSTPSRPKLVARFTDRVPNMSEPNPKPIIKTPLDRPTLSGNHTFVVAMTVL